MESWGAGSPGSDIASQPRVCPIKDRKARFRSLRRSSPFSREFGFDRGQPIDRRYIEWFLNGCAADISGHVLEIGGHAYSERFGGLRVAQQDVLHVSPGFPGATIVADLADAPHIPSDRFDCIILTHTLQFIHDIRAALATLHRILKPDGTLLATFPGISQICRDEGHRDADSLAIHYFFDAPIVHRSIWRWRDPGPSLRERAGVGGLLYGVATHELDPEELDHRDPDYPLLICVRARKDKNPDATI